MGGFPELQVLSGSDQTPERERQPQQLGGVPHQLTGHTWKTTTVKTGRGKAADAGELA